MRFKFLFLFIAILGLTNVLNGSNFVDSLKHKYSILPNDSNKVNVLIKLTWEYKYRNVDSAKYFIVEAEKLARQLKLSHKLGHIIYYHGILAYLENDYATAKRILNEALDHYEKHEDKYGLASIYNLLGLINTNLTNYEEAVQNYTLSLSLSEEVGNAYGVANPTHNIGIVYEKDRNFSEALKYYYKGLALRKAIGDADFIAQSHSSIGGVYGTIKQFDSALFHLNQALLLFKSQENTYMTVQSLINKGLTLVEARNLDSALQYLNQADSINEFLQNPETAVIICVNRSQAYLFKNEFKNALIEARKGLTRAHNIDILFHQQKLLYTAAQAFEALGLKDSALHYYKLNLQASDSLYSQTRTETISLLEKKFQSERKEKQILALNEQNLEASLALQESRFKVLLLLVILGLTLILSFIAYLIIKQQQRDKLNKAILEEQRKGFRQIVSAQEKERQRIAREIHDGVVQSLAGIKLKLESIASGPKAETQNGLLGELGELVQFTDETCDELRNLSHQLMPRALNELGLVDALRDLATKTEKLTQVTIEFDTLGELQNLDKGIEIAFFRTAQELVSNAIKHGKATHIHLMLTKTSQRLLLTVEDNGTGFNTDESSKGIGLDNLKHRAALIGAKFSIESEVGRGTIARMTLMHEHIIEAE